MPGWSKSPNASSWKIASRRVLEIVIFLFLLAGVWDAYVQITGIHRVLLPGPRDVARVLINSWFSLSRSMLETMQFILWGFSLGALTGVILGVLIRYVGVVRRMLHPVTAMVYVTPKSVFVPLFFLWWGSGPTYRLVVIGLLVFFPVMENTIAGLRSVDTDMVDLSRSLGGGKFFTFRKIELPTSLPFILAGLRLGLTEAFVGAIIVELIVPHSGIGAQIVQAGAQANTQFILAGIFVIAAFGITSYFLVERVERRLTFWY